MSMVLSPEPGIFAQSTLTVNVSKTSDIAEYTISSNGIPPVIAKYIAYDNLTPKNPFIATVEDGLGNVLLDGGFPKWYNSYYNAAATYAALPASSKYLYDGLTFISNKTKVAAGNKKILILGDANVSENYSIKSGEASGFYNVLLNVCNLKGYIPTFKTRDDYGGVLNATYQELDAYVAVVFFSTVYTSERLISQLCIESLKAFRDNGNGIFVITDHGEDLPNLITASTGTYFGFFRSGNYLITEFGCYFTGNFDRTPVSVGTLRQNYGNHILWANLSDSDYIYAGGSESKVIITEYTLYTNPVNITLGNGYSSIKILYRTTGGTLYSVGYTYGNNVPEIIFIKNKNNLEFTKMETMIREQKIINNIDFDSNLTGIIKLNSIPIATFNYTALTDTITYSYFTGYSENLIFGGNDFYYVQITSPISYTKSVNIEIKKPVLNLRANQILINLNKLEFQNNDTSSPFRNQNRFICKNISTLNQFTNRLKLKNIISYFS